MKVKMELIIETSRPESAGDLKRNVKNRIERTGHYKVEIVGVNQLE